jgi:hypothetical protein
VFFPPRRGGGVFLILLLVLGFWEDDIREGALAVVGQGRHTTWWRDQGWPAPGGDVAPWWPILASPSGSLHHLAK